MFEEAVQRQNFNESLNRIRTLLKLVKSALAKAREQTPISPKYEQVVKKYEELRINNLFMENVVVQEYETEALSGILKVLVDLLKAMLSGRDSPLECVHEFLPRGLLKTRQMLFKENSVGKCCRLQSESFHKILTFDCECVVCSKCANQMALQTTASTVNCKGCSKKNILLEAILYKICSTQQRLSLIWVSMK